MNFIHRARHFRSHMTRAEVILWSVLQSKQLSGYKFRRQHQFGRYIVDFYCPKLKLVIELDGSSHDSEAAQIYDHKRTLYLESRGLKVIRFPNKYIYQGLPDVLGFILRAGLRK